VSADNAAARLVLHVPGLATRTVGAGCCLIGLRTLVTDELRSWRGVRVLEVDDLNERVIIEIDDDATAHPDDLLESVRDLGAKNSTLESQRGAS
jgi:hypothetical protein